MSMLHHVFPKKTTQAFPKGFAKIACDIKLYGTVRNLIIYFAETFLSLLSITLLQIYYSSRFFSSPNFEQPFSWKASQWLLQLIHV